MGMSAAQARFLMITAQKSNNEYQAQTITYERLVLARETQAYALEYNEKMNNRTLLFDGLTSNGSTNYNAKLKYTDIVNVEGESNPDTCLDMRLVTYNGRVVVRNEDEIPDGADPKGYVVDPSMYNSYDLEQSLRGGAYAIEKRKVTQDDDISWEKVTWSTLPQVNDVLDITDDAEAQSAYDQKTSQFNSADKMLEMKLKQLETEHKALEIEADSVKKVVQGNIDKSFKTFSA